jgi:hypothetical protein
VRPAHTTARLHETRLKKVDAQSQNKARKQKKMAAAPQHIRVAPLARALRVTAATPSGTSNSRRALIGLSETDLRQVAVDLGQVPGRHLPSFLSCL